MTETLRPPAIVMAMLPVYAIILVCVLVEVYLTMADQNLIGSSRSRTLAYEYAGFWPGLLGNWEPNYKVQPYSMFLSYGFLHGGIAHLAVNMFTLWSVARIVVSRVGGRGFLLLYFASILGGGIGFGLLAPNLTPMVGASGALFGLVGGVLAWSYVDRYSQNLALWPVARSALILIALNLVMWWAMSGHLAWQTHLGGFISGWITAMLLDPRPGGDRQN